MQERTVTVGGETIRLFESGRGPTLLYLHGASGLSWYPLLHRLSSAHRVLAPEHPGFGQPRDLPDWLRSVGDLAFFYLDFLAALELDEVHLVGHSLGGWTAAALAIRSTSRLRTLALLAPAGVPAPEEPYGDIFLWNSEEHARNSYWDRALAEARVRALAAADPGIFLQNRAAAARLAWSPRLHDPQLPHWLHRIDVPVLLVWGEEDRICPFSCARTFCQCLPKVQLHALPRTGHALHTERAEEVANRLAAFVALA